MLKEVKQADDPAQVVAPALGPVCRARAGGTLTAVTVISLSLTEEVRARAASRE